MSVASEKLSALRDLLAGRFPGTARPTRSRLIATGVPAIDTATDGLPCGAITEIVCTAPGSGGTLLFACVLATYRQQRLRVALIDGTDTFDPQSFSQDSLAHLVWVRCRELRQTMQAADLLARDANFGLVIVDVRGHANRDLRREPSTAWYRLQHAAEQNDLPLLVATPRPLVPSATLRFVLDRSHSIDALTTERPTLIAQLTPMLQRQRFQSAAAS